MQYPKAGASGAFDFEAVASFNQRIVIISENFYLRDDLPFKAKYLERNLVPALLVP